MSDWTPTTQQVRDGYRYDPEYDYYNPLHASANVELRGLAFDRWLDHVKAEARADVPARPLPSREEIADVLRSNILGASAFAQSVRLEMADSVLDILKGQDS